MQMLYDDKIHDYICYADAPVLSVKTVEAFPDYTLKLLFSTGEQRLYNARQLMDYELYSPLEDIGKFMQAHSDGYTVVWDDELDIAPESLYAHSFSIQEPDGTL